MHKTVDVVFASCITVGVEVAVRVVGAREDSEADIGGVVVGQRCRLGTADGRLVVGATDCELVPVSGERVESGGFDLC